ncbi:MAG: ribosome-associated translation inhibitor RaiA [Sediminicola sp.]|tara:strand:+ start:148778 stop:149080 length:303 start_codon:yes stop_codon:yes gene_type:complete
MKVHLQSVNFNAGAKLINFVHSRLDKLEHFHDRIICSDVYLKLGNSSAKENKIAEIKVHVPKEEYIIKKQCRSFEEAVDMASSSLERKLVRHKQKLKAKN